MNKLSAIVVLVFLFGSNYQASGQYTISGNTGVRGVTLRYTLGNSRTALSDSNGSYSFSVPAGFSGTVSPFKKDYTFSPVNISYSNVQSDQSGQDFTETYSVTGPVIWNGPRTVVFTKANFADWTQPGNQDQIMGDVWITRGNTQAIFNIAKETSYKTGSPAGTEWAAGLISDYSSLTYTTGLTIPGGSLVGQNLVMHMIDDDIYVDVKFLSYTGGTSGGGFSYERSEGPAVVSAASIQGPDIPKEFKLGQNFPNPFNPVTSIEFTLAEESNVSLKIYDLLGHELVTLMNGKLRPGVLHKVQFDASRLSSGIYFYRLQAGNRSIIKKLTLIK